MTDQEIFDIARIARVADKTDTVESVLKWRRNPLHPVTKLLRIRFGVDIAMPQRIEYPASRVGIVHSVFNAIGGTETWCRQMVRHIPGIGGIATLDRPSGSIDAPLYHGEEAIKALCRACDTVLVWGMTSVHRDLFEQPRPKKLIAVHHGALNSDWACQTFEDQLGWCDGGIAVNDKVAEHYKVPWIPNIVEDHGPRKHFHHGSESRVAWIHRPSAEKRPDLMIEIAKHLPAGWKINATLGDAYPQDRLPPAVSNEGIITDPQKRRTCLESARVFLATPTDEGFGYSVAEAVERMVPVASSPHGIAKYFALCQNKTDDAASWVGTIERALHAGTYSTLLTMRSRLLSQYGVQVIRKTWEGVL